MAMCGVTRAPFNSNRSSCGIEVVVPFFFYPKFEHARMCSVPIHRLYRCLRGRTYRGDGRCRPLILFCTGTCHASSPVSRKRIIWTFAANFSGDACRAIEIGRVGQSKMVLRSPSLRHRCQRADEGPIVASILSGVQRLTPFRFLPERDSNCSKHIIASQYLVWRIFGGFPVGLA